MKSCGTGSTSSSRRTITPRPSCCCIRRAPQSDDLHGRRSRDLPGVDGHATTTRRSRTRPPARRVRNLFDPDLSAELYITNGDTLDHAYHTHGILGFDAGGPAPNPTASRGVFEFQDDEADLEAEFRRHLLFSLDLAVSAADPENPVSFLGNTVATSTSTSSPSPTAIRRPSRSTAKRSLGDVRCATASTAATCARPDQGGAGRRASTTTPALVLPAAARRGEGHRAR